MHVRFGESRSERDLNNFLCTLFAAICAKLVHKERRGANAFARERCERSTRTDRSHERDAPSDLAESRVFIEFSRGRVAQVHSAGNVIGGRSGEAREAELQERAADAPVSYTHLRAH